MSIELEPIDPSPRSYAEALTLLYRRASGGLDVVNRETIDAIFDWLLDSAIRERDPLVLCDTLCWRITATEVPLDRMGLHVGTLHPQIRRFGWGWWRSDRLCDDFKIDQSVMATSVFLESSLKAVIRDRLVCDARTEGEELCRNYPLIADFAGEGFKHYIATPLSSNGNFYNAISIVTQDPAGFTTEHIAAIRLLGPPFALLVDSFIGNRIARNVLDVYLGPVAGKKVLTGSIGCGDGDVLKAIIWALDMRSLTLYADNLAAPNVLALLNAYFECVAGAVTAHGGEVLKFIGDGLLAVFSLKDGEDNAAVAQASVAAAHNATPPPKLAAAFVLSPLKSDIALHEGEVFFGNMG